MKKTFFFEIEEWEKEYLKKHLKGASPVFISEKLAVRNVGKYRDAEAISTFINSNLKKDTLAKLPSLRFVCVRATGFDHVDTGYARKRQIAVSNVPAYGTTTVAEHTFGLMLAVSRKIFQSFERTERYNFDFHGLTGFDLEGKTLGLVGFGRIAQRVAEIARGFRMRVIAYDVVKNAKAARALGVAFVPLNSVLRNADILSFHTPYTPATHHLLNLKNIGSLKKGVVIINTARGALIDTKALLRGFERGIVAGAGLDVLEGERALREEKELLHESKKRLQDFMVLVENHLLVQRDDVIITPHNAFNSKEALERIMKTTVENIQGFMKGKPINVVNVSKQ